MLHRGFYRVNWSALAGIRFNDAGSEKLTEIEIDFFHFVVVAQLLAKKNYFFDVFLKAIAFMRSITFIIT